MKPGPFEEHPWPERLTGRVATVGSEPRLHGFDVHRDLSRHYSFAETVLLLLTGELPERSVGRAFEVCLAFLAPVSVAEAPANAALLARMSGSLAKGVLSVAAVTLAEQGHAVMTAHRELLDWLDHPDSPFPASYQSTDPRDQSAVERLREALGDSADDLPVWAEDPTLRAALVSVLHACGLGTVERLETAWLFARLPCVAAEGFAMRRAAYRDYPMTLPDYRYVAEPRDE